MKNLYICMSIIFNISMYSFWLFKAGTERSWSLAMASAIFGTYAMVGVYALICDD
jgi:hypothetical protein